MDPKVKKAYHQVSYVWPDCGTPKCPSATGSASALICMDILADSMATIGITQDLSIPTSYASASPAAGASLSSRSPSHPPHPQINAIRIISSSIYIAIRISINLCRISIVTTVTTTVCVSFFRRLMRTTRMVAIIVTLILSIACAILTLPEVGPTDQPGLDVLCLVQTPLAIGWIGVLTFATVACCVGMVVLSRRSKRADAAAAAAEAAEADGADNAEELALKAARARPGEPRTGD